MHRPGNDGDDRPVAAVTAERRTEVRAFSERIVVLAPTADDASLIVRFLGERGLDVVTTEGLESFAELLREGAGVALIASEALHDSEALGALKRTLDDQEPWSELPMLLIGGSGRHEASAAAELLGSRAQIVLLERPLALATFLTATDAALRSRRRQYQVRRLLEELRSKAIEIERVHEEATRAKDEFIATLAHELRSPMTAIRGWIEMLKLGDLGPEDAATALAMIDSSTRVQAHIVEDLMDVSKILAGKIMIEPRVVELGPIVARVGATFRSAAALQGIHLRVDVTAEPLIGFVDEIRLQQVGWNLVSNAIKFTPRGGSVELSLTRERDRAVIRVSDSGEGMTPELLPLVFERYRQAEGGTKRQQEGLGLGLAIVRHLVESHGGRVEARSEGRGQGSEFIVSLPLHDEE
jgi:two-component system, sensor histidine kinase